MISQQKRQFGPRFDRKNWSDPRFFRGHRRPEFFHGPQSHHRLAAIGNSEHLSSKHYEAQRQK